MFLFFFNIHSMLETTCNAVGMQLLTIYSAAVPNGLDCKAPHPLQPLQVANHPLLPMENTTANLSACQKRSKRSNTKRTNYHHCISATQDNNED